MNYPAGSFTSFAGSKRISSGELREVALKTKAAIDIDPWAQVVIFHAETSAVIELDMRGSAEDVLRRIPEPVQTAPVIEPETAEAETRRPGRPKLGVVAREVTLLPRHWDWLGSQPGGASVALRKLVEQARREGAGKDRLRRAQDAAYRFLSAMAGNLPGFEEATRALFGGDPKHFEEVVTSWPLDVREHTSRLAGVAFQAVRLGTSKAV